MGSNNLDEFFFNCVNKYEGKMDKVFHSAKSVNELMFSHQEFKSQVLRSIPEEWRATFGSKELPKSVKDSVSKKIDETYQQLKHHFQSEKEYTAPTKLATPTTTTTASTARLTVAEKQKCQEDALTFYTEEMNKYFENNTNPTSEDVAAQHKKTIIEAIAGMQNKGIGLKDGVVMMTKLAIQSRYKEDFAKKADEVNRPVINDIAIGIDLGTTMSCAMVVRSPNGTPEAILNRNQGNSRTTPSYVAYDVNGKDTFGTIAKNSAYKFPENTIYDAKRMIGRSWEDANLQRDMKSWPFEVVNENGNPKIVINGQTKYPHEISARLLSQFRVMAEDHLNLSRGSIRKAVVTVPAYFTELQRRATNDAAECAGLEVLNILSEPTAAAIAYSYEKRMAGTRNALIYDLGGGTFDVAIARVSDTNVDILVVDGDTHLGGEDFDRLLMDYCLAEFKKAEDYDLIAARNNPVTAVKRDALSALSRVKLQCQWAKEQLATCTSAEVFVDYLVGAKQMNVTITKQKLDELCKPLVKKTLEIVGRALESAQSKGIKGKEDIHDVILVGGSTRMLLVSEMLENYFNGKQLTKHINPDEAVAFGAAVQAAMLCKAANSGKVKNPKKEQVKEVKVEPEKAEEVKVGEIPKVKPRTTKGIVNSGKEIKVEEETRKIKVQDILPMSLGVELVGQVFSPIIVKNSNIPCTHSGIYWTAEDNQTTIQVKVFQGEAANTTENEFLGEFMMEGFPPKPAGEEKVEVTMKIDSMGILQVEAVSLSMGSREAITIVSDRLGIDMVTMEELRKKLEHLQVPESTF